MELEALQLPKTKTCSEACVGYDTTAPQQQEKKWIKSYAVKFSPKQKEKQVERLPHVFQIGHINCFYLVQFYLKVGQWLDRQSKGLHKIWNIMLLSEFVSLLQTWPKRVHSWVHVLMTHRAKSWVQFVSSCTCVHVAICSSTLGTSHPVAVLSTGRGIVTHDWKKNLHGYVILSIISLCEELANWCLLKNVPYIEAVMKKMFKPALQQSCAADLYSCTDYQISQQDSDGALVG